MGSIENASDPTKVLGQQLMEDSCCILYLFAVCNSWFLLVLCSRVPTEDKDAADDAANLAETLAAEANESEVPSAPVKPDESEPDEAQVYKNKKVL